MRWGVSSGCAIELVGWYGDDCGQLDVRAFGGLSRCAIGLIDRFADRRVAIGSVGFDDADPSDVSLHSTFCSFHLTSVFQSSCLVRIGNYSSRDFVSSLFRHAKRRVPDSTMKGCRGAFFSSTRGTNGGRSRSCSQSKQIASLIEFHFASFFSPMGSSFFPCFWDVAFFRFCAFIVVL